MIYSRTVKLRILLKLSQLQEECILPTSAPTHKLFQVIFVAGPLPLLTLRRLSYVHIHPRDKPLMLMVIIFDVIMSNVEVPHYS